MTPKPDAISLKYSKQEELPYHLANMNVNKKLDRFKQWAGERMGGEVKTNVSDDFKALETEMNLRHDGMSLIELFCDDSI